MFLTIFITILICVCVGSIVAVQISDDPRWYYLAVSSASIAVVLIIISLYNKYSKKPAPPAPAKVEEPFDDFDLFGLTLDDPIPPPKPKWSPPPKPIWSPSPRTIYREVERETNPKYMFKFGSGDSVKTQFGSGDTVRTVSFGGSRGDRYGSRSDRYGSRSDYDRGTRDRRSFGRSTHYDEY